MPGFSAKAAYFDWDRREVAHLTQTVPDFLRPFYIQARADAIPLVNSAEL
jgi:hypothetical protein